MRMAGILVGLVVAASPAVAQEPQGVYVGTGPNPLTATIFATEGKAPFAGRFTVGNPSDPKCAGDFAATGEKIDTNKLEFAGTPEGGKTCTITMTFTTGYNAAIVDEDGCSNYHGASCDFSGAVQLQTK